MAKIFTIYNPTKIVAVDTLVNELEFGVERSIDGASPSASGPKNHDFRDPLVPSPSGGSDERITLFVKVIAGSFKFNVGADPSSNTLDAVTDDIFTVTIHNRVSNLFFKATTAGDSFTVSA